MSGNSIGKLFSVTTFGESHGPALGCVIDGCPPGLLLNEDDIQQELNRRKTGVSPYVSQRREADEIKILSGVFEGKTTGTAIGLLLENHDARSQDYTAIKEVFRPGHADYSYWKKYGIRDYRGSGRASARETVMRVAAGAIAKKYLRENFSVEIRACLAQIGEIECAIDDWARIANNPFFCADANDAKISQIENFLQELIAVGDSIGACIYIEANYVPVGLGEPVFDKLEADIAHAIMSIPAVKGIEFGAGFAVVKQRGSEHRDALSPDGFLSNNAGGILGGISTGQSITARVAFKPASSLRLPVQSVDCQNRSVEVVTEGRHDPCVALRAVPIVEAMLAIVLMDHVLRNRGQCGK